MEPGKEAVNIKVDLYEYEPNDEIRQQAEEQKFQRRLSSAIEQ